MEKITKIMGITLLVSALAVPVFAWGPGGGRAGGMMGFSGRNQGCNTQYTRGGRGQGYAMQDNRAYGNLTQEQQTRLNELDRKFYDDTAKLRTEMWDKSAKVNTLLNTSDPDANGIKALQGEINDLRNRMSEAQIDHELEARKISPYATSGRGGRMGGGFGRGIGGFGPSTCWN
ncbi:MAG: periplasmic heavy metal sensor [Deltaproteobacteria bacterium]|nr:periplasmic heavy metal sensor [Deltaproteobacteria bacterium]